MPVAERDSKASAKGKQSGKEIKRCDWANSHELETIYHDEEWGIPVHADHMLFEMLILESAQSGLSWITVLKKRQGYRDAFSNFDIRKVARFTDSKIETLLLNPEIVRNRLKVVATVENAKRIIDIQKEFGSFDKYIWTFVEGKPVDEKRKKLSDVPSSTSVSIAMSKDLKKRGFKFVGPTTCYAFMQATGMVNDHLISCFRYSKVKKI